MVATSALMLVAVAACGTSVADKSSGSLSPAPSATPTQASSLWHATALAYPDSILTPATKDVGERSFPHRDIVVSTGGLELMDATARFAVITDNDSSQLRLVDLRTGTFRVVLASPVTIHHPPSANWVKAKAGMLRRVGRAQLPTQIDHAEVSGTRLVWQEMLLANTGGVIPIATAIFTAHIGPRMRLGDPELVAFSQPRFEPGSTQPTGGMYAEKRGLDYTFDGRRILLVRSGVWGTSSGGSVEAIDLPTNKRTALVQSPANCWTEAALVGKRAALCFGQSDEGRLLLYDFRQGPLPVNVAVLPHTGLPEADLRGLALARDGSAAWAAYYGGSLLNDDKEAVFLVSPGEPIRCLTADGGEPVFFGKTILWVGLNERGRFWLGGADTDTFETFTVAGGDRIRGWGAVAGSGHTAVVLVPGGGRGTSTLRVFDVE